MHEPAEGKDRLATTAAGDDLQHARLTLAAIVASSDDAIIGKNLDGIVTSWNAAASRVFGYNPDEIIGKSVLTLIPPELQFEEAEILSRIRSGNRIQHYETQRLHKSGHRVDVSLTVSPIKDDTGRVIGASKIARDITERKRSDEARLRLAAIVESSDDAIIGKDLQGIITSWNPGASRIFGYSSEEIVGKSILELIPSELWDEEPVILSKLKAGQRIEHYETVRLNKDGTRINVSLTVSPIRNSSGLVIGVSKIARDISQQRKAQAVLIESEKLAATGRMAAVIAHEINNPLEAITNLGYLISINPSLNDEARKYAELLLAEVNRASEITRQTLAFFRDTTRPADVRLAEMMENLLDLNKRKLTEKEIQLTRELDATATVRGYGAELRQVLANLLLNAIDAVDNDGRVHIRLRMCGPNKSKVRVTFVDTGAGILPEIRNRMFEPFFTTKGTQGNGLGLWVSSGIVKKHDGKIQFRSSSGPNHCGTVFSVVLPRFPASLAKVA